MAATVSSVGLLLGLALPALGAEVVAKKSGVVVYSGPTKTSPAVGTLNEGQSVQSGERKGLFWEVKTADGKAGFVSVMDVASKPGGASEGMAKAIRDVVKEGRESDEVANSRARSAVMGVRGLDETEEIAAAGNARPNLRMVYEMEDLTIDKQALKRQNDLVSQEIEGLAKGR